MTPSEYRRRNSGSWCDVMWCVGLWCQRGVGGASRLYLSGSKGHVAWLQRVCGRINLQCARTLVSSAVFILTGFQARHKLPTNCWWSGWDIQRQAPRNFISTQWVENEKRLQIRSTNIWLYGWRKRLKMKKRAIWMSEILMQNLLAITHHYSCRGEFMENFMENPWLEGCTNVQISEH